MMTQNHNTLSCCWCVTLYAVRICHLTEVSINVTITTIYVEALLLAVLKQAPSTKRERAQ